MTITRNPIAEVINYLYKHPDAIGDNQLIHKITNLVDLIGARIQKKGIQETLESLRADFFELKFEILNDKILFTSINDKLEKITQERISSQFENTTTHKELEQYFVNTMNIYGKIAQNIYNKIPKENLKSIGEVSKKLNYQDFVKILKSLPNNAGDTILSYINASIELDFSLLVTDLIFENTINLKKKEIKNVSILSKNAIENFAVYAYAINLWKPEEEDESQWMRNIKIRISLFETQHSNLQRFTSSEFQNMWLA